MAELGSAVARAPRAREAAREAARAARNALKGATPVLAFTFASADYDDVGEVPQAIADELHGIPVVGGTASAAMFDASGTLRSDPRAGARRSAGVLVALIGGDDARAVVMSEPIGSSELVELVPAAERIARASDAVAVEGLTELTCFAFAPSGRVDGEALVAALRKGSGARAQLAGGLTGDDFTFDRAQVLSREGAHTDRVVLAGLFTRTPLGVAVRHGWQALGRTRTITAIDGPWLLQLDNRPAFDVWREDARAAGAPIDPSGPRSLTSDAASYQVLGLVDRPSSPRLTTAEPVVRAVLDVRADGALRLSSPLPDQARVRVMRAAPSELLDASREAARQAKQLAGGSPSGALLFSCAGRLGPFQEQDDREPRAVAEVIGAPIAGACVSGEIARAPRDLDAFHNTSAVVVAIPR